MSDGRVLNIDTPRKFVPLLAPGKRYRAAHGGRGSGKSHFFGEMLIERAEMESGLNAVCIREVQRTIAQSSKKLIEDKIAHHRLGHRFKIFKDAIETPGDGVIIFRGMSGTTAESIKSLEGFKIAWADEAQALSARSLSLLRPTIRMLGSEIWASWNPTRKKDAIDDFFRGKNGPPADSVIVEANWRDNPYWTPALEAERQTELRLYPERYSHTFEGGYAGAFEGAYFAGLLNEAKLQGRIGKVPRDDMLPLRGFIDIGGAGAKADAFVIWVVQWVGQEIRILDHYEAQGQVLAAHVNWVRKQGYENALFYLPHDGSHTDKIVGKTYRQHWEEAGLTVEQVVPNQGPGAASIRIENVRRHKNRYWFNDTTTEGGRLALGFYHEKRDDERGIGMGPMHDWSSHSADGFGLMASCYEEPHVNGSFNRKIEYLDQGYA